ncbi:MAG: prepilin peptidase [Planctomycetaceae bacterium]
MIPYDLPQWIALLWLFVLGSAFGSFLNVCIYRIPQHENLWQALRSLGTPPSACPFCKTPIAPYDNIPLLGWLNLRGRCRSCKHWIPIRYPAIELLNGLLVAGLYWLEIPADFSSSLYHSGVYAHLGPAGVHDSVWLSPQAILHWRYLYHVVLIEALVAATFIDFDLRIIPDGVTLPALAVGVFGATAIGHVHLVPLWFQSPELLRNFFYVLPESMRWMIDVPTVPAWFAAWPHLHGLLVSLAGIVVGGGSIWIVRIVGHWFFRQEAMGFGDVMLVAMIGSFLGWQASLIVFFLAPACAMVVVLVSLFFHRNREIPYGPYLALATVLLLFGWQTIWPIAEPIMGLGPLLPFVAVFMVVMLIVTLAMVQGIKWIFGIPLFPEEFYEEWTSGDQLFHFAGERHHAEQLQKTRIQSTWPGELAGKGQLHEQIWKGTVRPLHSPSRGLQQSSKK